LSAIVSVLIEKSAEIPLFFAVSPRAGGSEAEAATGFRNGSD